MFWRGILRIFPEVIDLAEGVGDQAGIFFEAEMVFEDGGDEVGEFGITGQRGVFKAVLAIAVSVIEESAFH